MKKLNIVFDEITIISFPFLGKLLKRYYILSLAVVFSVLTFFYYFYTAQNTIHSLGKGFKNVHEEGSSPTSALSAAIGEKPTFLSEQEVLAIVNGVDFRYKLASVLYEHPEFHKLNFNGIEAKGHKLIGDFIGHCSNDKKCIVLTLSQAINGFVIVTQDKNVENHFSTVVRTRDELTTSVILESMEKVLIDVRLAMIRYNIDQQIAMTTSLIKGKNKEIKDLNLLSTRANVNKLREELKSIDREIAVYSHNYYSQLEQLKNAKSIYDETKQTVNRKISSTVLKARKRSEQLAETIASLEGDIQSLEGTGRAVRGTNKAVLASLKKKLKDSRKEYKEYAKYDKSQGHFDNFQDGKNKSYNMSEFDYKVLQKSFKETKKTFENLTKKKEGLVKELTSLGQILEENKSTLGYMEVLQSKLVQLKLAQSTIVSDIVFDKFNFGKRAYKKVNLTRTILFFFAVTFFGLILVCAIRYLFDDKIYDVRELQENFKDLKIIGNTPDFN